MNFRARNSNITKVLYIVLVLCIISIMFLSIYSMLNQNESQANKNNRNSLSLDSSGNNALNNNFGDGEGEEAIFDFFKRTTTESTTEPQTQRPTQKPTFPPTEPFVITEAPTPPLFDEQPATDIKIDPVIEATEDSVQVINEQSLFKIPPFYFKPSPGYVSRRHNPDKPEYSIAMNDYRTHMGIDIESEVGVNVKAVAEGIITDIYDDPLMGKTVVIDHADNIQSLYMNLQEMLPKNIIVGNKINGGDVIGGVGETALIEISDVPHLHLEMKKDGKYIDPLDYIKY